MHICQMCQDQISSRKTFCTMCMFKRQRRTIDEITWRLMSDRNKQKAINLGLYEA